MSAGFVRQEAPVTPFLFGKMPAHGDFISRGLDDDTVETGDAAVAEAVALASSHWDMAWDDVYIETPVWRFLAAPGVLGRDWLSGVFLPSVDAVGRQFPLLAGFAAPTLALLARPDATALALDEAEALARAALLDALSVDTVLDRLTAIADRAFGAEAAGSGDPVAVFAGGMLRQLEAVPWGAEALWWVAGGDVDARLRFDGPLSGEALARLFRRAEIVDAPPPDDDEPAVVHDAIVAPVEDKLVPAADAAPPADETSDAALPDDARTDSPATPSEAPADAV